MSQRKAVLKSEPLKMLSSCLLPSIAHLNSGKVVRLNLERVETVFLAQMLQLHEVILTCVKSKRINDLTDDSSSSP